jgi:hypothetical protein
LPLPRPRAPGTQSSLCSRCRSIQLISELRTL